GESGMLVGVGLGAKHDSLTVVLAELKGKALGKTIRVSASSAEELRLRPIVMTSVAFIFGTLPLALATGASDVSSHHIGTTVAMGMASVAILGSFFVPTFYALIAAISDWLRRKIKGEEVGLRQQPAGSE
ncbi:MAG: efflux RND transporter permease subunit, partial [Alteromonadaceae bacterium]|nr:efflux RND transporter permease subunit [Alteromonadaceae bacterium]